MLSVRFHLSRQGLFIICNCFSASLSRLISIFNIHLVIVLIFRFQEPMISSVFHLNFQKRQFVHPYRFGVFLESAFVRRQILKLLINDLFQFSPTFSRAKIIKHLHQSTFCNSSFLLAQLARWYKQRGVSIFELWPTI